MALTCAATELVAPGRLRYIRCIQTIDVTATVEFGQWPGFDEFGRLVLGKAGIALFADTVPGILDLSS